MFDDAQIYNLILLSRKESATYCDGELTKQETWLKDKLVALAKNYIDLEQSSVKDEAYKEGYEDCAAKAESDIDDAVSDLESVIRDIDYMDVDELPEATQKEINEIRGQVENVIGNLRTAL